MKPTLLILIILLITSVIKSQPTITVTSFRYSGWTIDITPANLTGGPGSDLESSYISTINFDTINIITNTPDDIWKVEIKQNTLINWDNDIILTARLTGNGEGSGTFISDGKEIILNDSYQTLFSGIGSISGITIQFKVCGISINTITPGSYTAEVIYSIINTKET